MLLNRRKHYSQMNENEVNAIKEVISELGEFSFTPYSMSRLVERKIDEQSVLNAIKDGVLIEVHNNKRYDIRALLRLTINKVAVCVVLSLRDKAIITSYINSANYHHPNLDMSLYVWKAKMTKDLIYSVIK
jgi:hypothetical protein